MKRWLIFGVVLTVLCVAPWLGGVPDAFVFWQIRVPRTLLAFLVGATLGLSGAIYQILFNNPLATPSTLGTTAGAALGALAAFVLCGDQHVAGLPMAVLLAFFGALSVTAIIAAIAASGRATTSDVLLAGIAISLAAGAISSGLQFSADMASTFQAVRWSLGHLGVVGYHKILLLTPLALIAWLTMIWPLRALESLVVGEDRAFSQGVNVRRVRALCLSAGALGVGAGVALTGPIAFVGLIVPHLVRLTLGASRSVLIPLSWLFGGVFLVICDVIARNLLSESELPVGVLTAGIGAPLIVWLVARRWR